MACHIKKFLFSLSATDSSKVKLFQLFSRVPPSFSLFLLSDLFFDHTFHLSSYFSLDLSLPSFSLLRLIVFFLPHFPFS